MNDTELLEVISTAKKDFGAKCSKYAGAVCAEIIKHALSCHGIEVSSRDVFINGVPIEIDLLIAREDARPKNGLLYSPEDVLVVLEIKNSGVFDRSAIAKIKNNFDSISAKNSSIVCMYVTLAELKGYRYAITPENLGYPAYTLFMHNNSRLNRKYELTGQWSTLISDLRRYVDCNRI